jgi:RimJ/RimL family protein N-acetyltransferase
MLIAAGTLPTIAASRVSLRWLTERDIPGLFAIFSHPEVMRYWSSPPYRDVAAAERLLEKIHACFAERSLFQWGLVRNVEGDLVGTCTLARLDAQNRRAELGYALGRPHWRRGYMREGVRALLGFAFEELALHRLEADVDPRNVASVKMLEQLGFRREGYLRERWIVGEEISDSAVYGLLRTEWRP